MALKFYDENQEELTTLIGDEDPDVVDRPLRTSHDGRLGGVHERLIYLRNNDPANYYTNVVVEYISSLYEDSGEFGTTGWGVKFMYGERRPTEAEWDLVRSGESVPLADIGSTYAADTYTYHPIWVRVYCPGLTAAQIRESQKVRVSYAEKKVGA